MLNIFSFVLLTVVALLATLPASAQQTGKIFRIGFLDPTNASDNADRLEAFRQELRKLGWIEGKNIAFEYRFAEQKPGRGPELAAELVRLKVDLIVTSGTPSALAAKKATTTIPIIIGNTDPVALGLVDSLARPGGECHRPLDFSDRAKYQKVRDTQGRGTQARPSWTSEAVGIQPGGRTTTRGAQGCCCGAKSKVGGDQDSSRRPRSRERL